MLFTETEVAEERMGQTEGNEVEKNTEVFHGGA